MRTSKSSIDSLLRMIKEAAETQTYNIAADLRDLKNQYKNLSRKDFQRVLEALIEKYESGEVAEVHAALVQKCRAGDVEAIRLYREMQKDGDAGGSEVVIVDNI